MKTTLAGFICASVLFVGPAATAQTAPPRPADISNRIEAQIVGLPNQPAPRRSEAELKAEIGAQPQSFRAYAELAQLYRSNNRIDEADAVLRSALGRVPNTDAVYGMLASLYPPVYQPEKVLAIAEEWQRAAPGVRPLTMIATAHIELAKRLKGSRNEALMHLDDAARAAADAKAMGGDNVPAAGLQAHILRTRAEFETDPAARAKLLLDAETLMREAQLSSQRYPPPPPPLAPPSSGGAASGGPIRVGGNIKAPVKIKDVRPVYPPEAQQARIQGVVICEVTIDGAGRVTDARVLRSIPLLDQAAVDAVRQWEFTPTLLNGVAIPVIMTVTVSFTMM